MQHLLSQLLPALQNFGSLFYWFIFVVAIVEALPFIGTFLPGATLVAIAGLLSAQGYYHFSDLVWVVSLGAILGDCISYWLGTKGTHFFKYENRVLKLSHLDRGKAFFKKHGKKSVFLGRFINVTRSVIPFIAGITRMDLNAFLLWNILSGIVWSVLYLSLGHIVGRYVPHIDRIVGKIGVISIVVFAGTMAILVFWKKVKTVEES